MLYSYVYILIYYLSYYSYAQLGRSIGTIVVVVLVIVVVGTSNLEALSIDRIFLNLLKLVHTQKITDGQGHAYMYNYKLYN